MEQVVREVEQSPSLAICWGVTSSFDNFSEGYSVSFLKNSELKNWPLWLDEISKAIIT